MQNFVRLWFKPMKKQPDQSPRISDIPAGWTLIDTLKETRLIEGCTFHLRGYACQRQSDQKIVTGSWAGCEEPSLDKAWLELMERMAIIQAMDLPASHVWPIRKITNAEKIGFTRGPMIFPQSPDPGQMQYAKSNGVALGDNFADAAERAACELIERHLVLGSWYGASRPRPYPMPLPQSLIGLLALYNFTHYDFGSFALKDLGLIHARGTFLWPVHSGHPVIYGFGAALEAPEALHKALSEALQRLAFLDPLEVPTEEPTFTPTPDFHQEYFLHPARRSLLKAWLEGAPSYPVFRYELARSGEGQAIDLTPTGSDPGYAVVRIMISGTLPLAFGRFQPSAFPDLPERFWIHPIV